MPSNLTWWQAARYARAGIPVRRAGDVDPFVWFVYDTGIFFRYEEQNTSLASPQAADSSRQVVKNTDFGSADFEAVDWTTDGLATSSADLQPASGPFPERPDDPPLPSFLEPIAPALPPPRNAPVTP